jgi:pyrroline-5-carboxylate reductase
MSAVAAAAKSVATTAAVDLHTSSMFNRIVIIGAGALGSAIIRGIRPRIPTSTTLVVCTRGSTSVEQSTSHVVGADALRAAVRDPSTDLVVLCVKPYQIDTVAATLLEPTPSAATSETTGNRFVLLSCCAGVTIASLEARFGSLAAAVVRCMPSTAAALGASATAWFPSASLSSAGMVAVSHFIALFGSALRVQAESHIDIATALAGSGTAYALLFMEAQIDAGVAIGLSREHARHLVVQTFLGASLLAQDQPKLHIAALRSAVVSPGGTTAAGLRELERGGVRTAISDSIHATFNKAREIRERAEAEEKEKNKK